MVYGVGRGVYGVTAPAGTPTGATYLGLAAPVHTLQDYQVEYDGLLIGPGTPYEVPQGGHDFLDLATVKTMDVARIWADGSFSGPDFSDVATPQMTVEITGTTLTDFQSNVARFRDVFTIQAAAPLWFKMPGFPAMGMQARVSKRSIPSDWGWNGGLIVAGIQFRATDPSWQSVARTLNLTANSGTASGLVFPMFTFATGTYTPPGVADFGNTDVTSSSATLTNAGNAQAWPVVDVPGPSSGFTVIIDGNAVTYTGSLRTGDVLEIDYSTGQATLNGTADRTVQLTSRQFSPVPPQGTSNVFFTATTGTASVTVADIWR